MMNNDLNDFLRTFHILTYSNSKWQVWQDFIFMSACSFSNAVSKVDYKNREEAYLKTINKYSKKDQQLFPKLLAKLTIALNNNSEQDFLGEAYTQLGLTNSNRGQFFTPYNVCKLMAEVLYGTELSEKLKKKSYISINDCACGSGATLIAAINTAKNKLSKENINYQDHILVAAQDIDQTVALMCYIQISLLGAAGYVKVGDSLSDPMRDNDDITSYWFTPMYYSNTWMVRRMLGNDPLLRRG